LQNPQGPRREDVAYEASLRLANSITSKYKQYLSPLGWFYDRFNRVFGRATHGYVDLSRLAIRKTFLSLALLGVLAIGAGFFGAKLPSAFLPEED